MQPGTVVAGRYKIERKLGEGGMGAVYAAEQMPLGRKCALKIIRRALTDDEMTVKRFVTEAKAVSQLDHPGIVTIFDFGSIDGKAVDETDAGLFIAMELLDGIDVHDLILARGMLPYRRAARIGADVARALFHAHERGIVHRDLKPDNIMLVAKDGAEQVKVVDFGIAKLRQDGVQSMTQTGMVMGTPGYIAPELVNGIRDDKRSDLYALGVILYELLLGQSPFDAETPVKLVLKHLTEPVVRLRDVRPELPEALCDLVLALLQKEPDQRPGNARLVAEQLEAIAGDASLQPPVEPTPPVEEKRPQGTVSMFAPVQPRVSTTPVTAAYTPDERPVPTPQQLAPVVPPAPAPPTQARRSGLSGCLMVAAISVAVICVCGAVVVYLVVDAAQSGAIAVEDALVTGADVVERLDQLGQDAEERKAAAKREQRKQERKAKAEKKKEEKYRRKVGRSAKRMFVENLPKWASSLGNSVESALRLPKPESRLTALGDVEARLEAEYEEGKLTDEEYDTAVDALNELRESEVIYEKGYTPPRVPKTNYRLSDIEKDQ